jgi:hypothetical protein
MLTQWRIRNVNDVDTTQRPRMWRDMEWRDVTSMEEDRDQTSWPTQLRYFIAIWFESYIVVSQAFLTLNKNLDLNSMFLKVGK